MIYDDKTARQVAKFLLEKEAVILRPDDPFTWASGWKSPIYCDNRVLLSFPDVRTFLKLKLGEICKLHFEKAMAVVGVATAGIPHATLVADQLNMPMAYARVKAKDHGRQNIIEGKLDYVSQIVVVEDLISTGNSSFSVVKKLREQSIKVAGLIAIFSYDFPISSTMAEKENINFFTLTDYNYLIPEALEMGYIKDSDVDLLKEWRKNPSEWGK